MERYFFRIAISLVTFFLGIGATLLWVTLRAPGVRDLKVQEPDHITRRAACAVLGGTTEPNGWLVRGGVLQGKAISKPAPPYPPAAKAAGVQGQVVVEIVVDESGRVSSAQAISGHPLLRAAAEEAATQARFTPTLISGQPVKVSGFLTYNFVLQ
jgi:TonB family protein